jgi:hypothetical protein
MVVLFGGVGEIGQPDGATEGLDEQDGWSGPGRRSRRKWYRRLEGD